MTSASSAMSVRLVQRETLRSRARSSRRRGGPCQSSPERTVLVSATIRIAAVPSSAYGVDLGLYVLGGHRRQVQRIELGKGLSQTLSGLIAGALAAGLQEIDKILDLSALLGREGLQLLDE